MDILDTRDLIEQFEELEANDNRTDYEETLFAELESLLEDLKDNGGDEQWRGNWYPITLISEDDFTEYCQELLQDCGDIPSDLPWFIEKNLDWDGIASDMKIDYCETSYNDTRYYYR